MFIVMSSVTAIGVTAACTQRTGHGPFRSTIPTHARRTGNKLRNVSVRRVSLQTEIFMWVTERRCKLIKFYSFGNDIE